MESLYEYILKNILPELNKYGVELVLDFENNYVYANSLPCSGYFDDKKLKLFCAIGTKNPEDWFGTLLHEFSHFEQWKEQCDAWINSQPKNGINSDELMDQWLSGKDIENINEILESIAYLEYDCEIRTAKKMEKFSLMFNVSDYIKKSNAYVAFYKILSQTRKWYNPDSAPYLLKDIWENMPSSFKDWSEYSTNYQFYNIDWKKCQ